MITELWGEEQNALDSDIQGAVSQCGPILIFFAYTLVRSCFGRYLSVLHVYFLVFTSFPHFRLFQDSQQ